MISNIEDFKAKLAKKGILRNNRFLVFVPPMRGVEAFKNRALGALAGITGFGSLLASSKLTGSAFIAFDSALPGKTVEVRNIKVGCAPHFKVPYVQDYDPITMSFLVGKNGFEYLFFEQWMNDIQNQETSNLNYYDEFTTTVTVYQYDEQNNIMIGAELIEAYPIRVQNLELSMNQHNQFHVITVTFAFRAWRNVLTKNSLKQTALGILNKVVGRVVGTLTNDVLKTVTAPINNAISGIFRI